MSAPTILRRAATAATTLLLLSAPAFLTAAPAQAATNAPRWAIASHASPTDFSPAVSGSQECRELEGGDALEAPKCDLYYVTATDVGAAPMKARSVTLEDTLPPGLSVLHLALFWEGIEAAAGHNEAENLNEMQPRPCAVSGSQIKCTLPAKFFTVEVGRTLQPDDSLILEVQVEVKEPALPGTLTNTVKVEGGEAPAAEASVANTLEQGPPAFGPSFFFAPALDPSGAPDQQADSHPYELPTRIYFNSAIREGTDGRVDAIATENPRDILVDLPPGLAGSALSTPVRCTFAQFDAAGENHVTAGENGCPAESRIGFLRSYPVGNDTVKSPIFNLVPERGVAAEFGYTDIVNGTHLLKVTLAPGPGGYILRTTTEEAPEIPLAQIIANIYGDPAKRQGSSIEPHVPTLTMPAECSGEPLRTEVHTDSWQHPGPRLPDGEPDLSGPAWVTKTYETPPISGCNQLEGLFNPTLEAHPTTTQGDQPTGLEVTLKVPQSESVETLATPPLKRAVVTLPQGMSVNPSSANGLQGCSLAQLGLSASGQPNGEPVLCPESSKIGTLELNTPALPGTLQGQIYVARQSENPFGSLLAIYLVVDDPATGVLVKIPGEVRADPATGQLQTVIDNSPQFPFSELRTRFLTGQKAPLRTPAVCGSYEVTSTLTPWSAPESGPPAEPAGSFEINQGCAPSAAQQPNKPAFEAGTLQPLAGAYSPFVLKLHREDGSQEIAGLNATLPEGLIGKLAGVGECSEAQLAIARSREHEGGGAAELASASCPASSEVGTVTVAAGAGLTPYYTTGRVYLAGPYKGAPLSLAIITPAVAGPFDLGDVLVRTALRVGPETAQISAVSDPLPTLLDGIPLDIRAISLQMARPQFTLNPTDCEALAVTGEALSTLNMVAPLSNPFRVGGCQTLAFKPRLSLRFKGKTNRTANPKLIADLTMKPGEANIASAQVKLPKAAFLDNAHIGTICTRVQFFAGAHLGEACPPASVYGHAKAITPLLEAPLEGNVYLRANPAHQLPDLVAALGGQIEVALEGKTDSVKGALRNTFEAVPDAPVSSFRLELFGGHRGLIEMSSGFCAHPKATAHFVGQNGKVFEATPRVKASCGKGKGGKPQHHRRGG